MNLFALVNGAPWIFGPVTFAGTITFTGSALLADGSAAAPALAFAADTDTGIFRPGTHEIAFATGGTERASFISQGLKLSNVGGSFTVPNVFANGDQDTGLAVIGGNRLALIVGGATGLCFNASGNVLIGTTTDGGQKLQVNGSAIIGSTSFEEFGTDGTAQFYAASGGTAQLTLTSGGYYDWRIRGTSTTMALRRDSTDMLSFDTSSNATFANHIKLGSGKVIYFDGGITTYIQGSSGALFIGTNGASAISIDSSQNATFAGAVRINGNVGFYNQAPVAKPTGVAVTAAAIHAALVTLNLISA